MLFPQFDESGDRDVENVVSIMLVNALDFGSGCQALRVLEFAKLRLLLCIQSKGQRRERPFLFRVQETSLLKKERNPSFAAFFLPYYFAYCRRSCICDWRNLDEFGFVQRFGFPSLKSSIEIDIPFGHQPRKGLKG